MGLDDPGALGLLGPADGVGRHPGHYVHGIVGLDGGHRHDRGVERGHLNEGHPQEDVGLGGLRIGVAPVGHLPHQFLGQGGPALGVGIDPDIVRPGLEVPDPLACNYWLNDLITFK